jgi:hypothetical protein
MKASIREVGLAPKISGLLGSSRDDGVCCSLHTSLQDIAGQADHAWSSGLGWNHIHATGIQIHDMFITVFGIRQILKAGTAVIHPSQHMVQHM